VLRGRSICLFLVVLTVGALAAPVAWALPGDGRFSILVMGDSYSAGNGGGGYYGPKGCRRSRHNYGEELGRIVRRAPYRQQASVRTVACNGAVTADLLHARSGRPAQVEEIDRGPDLILLTIGGNDLGFAGIVRSCLLRVTRAGARCGPLLAGAERMLADGTIAGRVKHVLAVVRKKADPAATIVLLGYPYLEGDAGYRLPSLGDVGKRLRHIEDLGDAIERDAVKEVAKPRTARLLFAGTKKLFAGPPSHELFAERTNPDRWFIQPWVDSNLFNRDVWYHPNPAGWRAEARLLARDRRVPKRDPIP
jgi:lysophospholipase L1-like esterase